MCETFCGWDGSSLPAPGSSRGAAVGTLLCVASAATLASVRWGLKNDGLYCVAIMLAALVEARVLASANHAVANGLALQSMKEVG